MPVLDELRAFPLVLGGVAFGSAADTRESFAILDAFRAAGGRHLDTADLFAAPLAGYVGGESETVIGRWLAARRCRNDVVLATKVGIRPGHDGLPAATVRASVEASLRRLRTDRIDLLYLHVDEPEIPVAEFLVAVDSLLRDGMVGHLGAADITGARLEESLAAAEHGGLAPYVVVQPPFSLVRQQYFDAGLREVVSRRRIGVLAREPLHTPVFSTANSAVPASVGLSAAIARSYRRAGYVRGTAVVDELQAIAQERGVHLGAIALAWVRTRDAVLAPVNSVRTVEQLEVLLASVGVTLSCAEIERLDTAARRP